VADPTADVEVKEDDFDPDEHYEPKTKTGDIFQLGDHRLMCGDSTNAEDVAKLMNGEKADLWLTDPPYNCGYGVEENKTREQQDHHKPIENDKMDDAEYQQFLLNVFKCASDNMREGAAYYIWYSDKEHSKYQLALSQLGIPYKAMLIWNKNTFVLSFNDYKQKHEVCLYGWKPGVKHYFVDKRNLTSVYEDFEELDIDKMKKSEMQKLLHDIFDNPTPTTVINEKKPVRSEAHPTMKPVRLFGYQIANSSRPGNIILDTFGGSGTTIVACEQLGRKARLMELDPHYCDVIIARWEKLTGQKAVKL
jgi:site-specific DNA-methyltransferase (adenine-specific)